MVLRSVRELEVSKTRDLCLSCQPFEAIKEALMTPPESTAWECHGTGTSLGDPIEARGMCVFFFGGIAWSSCDLLLNFV